jgi:hypothetical protein
MLSKGCESEGLDIEGRRKPNALAIEKASAHIMRKPGGKGKSRLWARRADPIDESQYRLRELPILNLASMIVRPVGQAEAKS